MVPIRLDLDRKTKSGVVTVTNDDDKPLRVQAQAFEWTQSASGEDKYEESGDLVFFPKLVVIEPKQSQLFRVGTRLPAIEKEKTYRLYIEELAAPTSETNPGVGVSIALRFGVPVFVAPPEPSAKLSIETATVAAGRLTVRFANPGNSHARVQTLRILVGDKLVAEANGWYVLAGARRDQSVDIPNEACRSAPALQVEVVYGGPPLRREVPLAPSMCKSG
ncbi:MAG TPA: fimbria/pilus periplasmic chaperone [Burkholderiales bacterium]|nr:fimbria/pilus periplasmic chaperone [Burkholderiales bacterium]